VNFRLCLTGFPNHPPVCQNSLFPPYSVAV
jgi:hypothetical protein